MHIFTNIDTYSRVMLHLCYVLCALVLNLESSFHVGLLALYVFWDLYFLVLLKVKKEKVKSSKYGR